jgi:alcohol dehydrogenase
VGIKVDTTIRGTDLHILKGDVLAITDEHILGQEALGTVVETGSTLGNKKDGMYSHYLNGADGPWVTP